MSSLFLWWINQDYFTAKQITFQKYYYICEYIHVTIKSFSHLSLSLTFPLSHIAGLWVGSEGFHQLSLSLSLTLPDCEWAVKASTSCEAQVTCSWVGENARWTMGTWEGWMTCLPVNPILAPSRDCCSIPSKSAKITQYIQLKTGYM